MSERVSFDQFLDAIDIQFKDVDLGSGRSLRVGSLTAADMIDWMEEKADPIKGRDAGLRLLVRSAVDAANNRIVPSDASDEIREEYLRRLRRLGAAQVGLVVNACLELNGLKVRGGAVAAIERAKKG